MIVEAAPGDVILLDHGEDFIADPITRLIQKATRSPYSHTIVVIGNGSYADANPEEDNDITVFGDALLEHLMPRLRSMSLFRWNGGAVDPRLLAGAVEAYRARGRPGPGQLKFSDGALVGLGLLITLQGLPPAVRRTTRCERLQSAVFCALEDGDGRLFCSEFVYRVLKDAGLRPRLPVRPVISLDGFPTDDPPESLRAWIDRIKTWLWKGWMELAGKLGLDDDTFLTLEELWAKIRDAYDSGRTPARLEIANFFTPADFASSPSFHLAALRTADTRGWVEPVAR